MMLFLTLLQTVLSKPLFKIPPIIFNSSNSLINYLSGDERENFCIIYFNFRSHR